MSLGVFYPPRNYIRMGVDSNVSQQMPFGVQDSKLVFKLKVIRPFINMVTIPRQTMFYRLCDDLYRRRV
ncbi:adhesin [Salmonella enterica subsp. enterica]|uniref:Adhesin n=1 Tax=Salmonella enterica I TaxID=59201 RepID=A0A447U826_SALET|nr:adhesin [Salmonella enterica subsp. enterica]